MRKGFTLLELLIVIIIIGILAVFALPQMFQATDRAREARAVHILGEVRNAQQMRFGLGLAAVTAYPVTVDVNGSTAVNIADPSNAFYTFNAPTATDAKATKAGTGGHRTVSINYATGALTWT
jgi:prepilin-type N-terminal cleavage/methylation domain-containing protein